MNNTVWCNWWVTVNKETWWVSTNQYVVYMSCQNFFDDLNICVYSVRSLKKQFLWRHSRCWRCKMRTTSWLRSLIIITKARVILWRCNILHLYWKKSQTTSIRTLCVLAIDLLNMIRYELCFVFFLAQGWALKTQKTVERVETKVREYTIILWCSFSDICKFTNILKPDASIKCSHFLNMQCICN